jgi:hypothetical protein
MPNIRIGFSSDFVLKNGVVGLGTTVGSTTDGKLELGNGDIRGNFSVSGVATLTAYGGFVAQKQHVNKPAAIGFGTVGVGTYQQYYETTTEFTDLGGVHHGDDQYFNTLSEDLIIDDGQILNITNTAMSGVTTIGEYDPHTHQSYVCAGSLEQVSVTEHFSVPCGGTNERKVAVEGTVRFNDDLATLEFFNGNEWRQFTYNQGQSGRAIFGGANQGANNALEYITISTLGNAINFGDTADTHPRHDRAASCSSNTRGIIAGGRIRVPATANTNTIGYFALASSGRSVDFGNLTRTQRMMMGVSSSTRGVFAGGYNPTSNIIDYIEIDTTGNALDFGDLTFSNQSAGSFSNGVIGVWGGGYSPARRNEITKVTIASKGDSVDFGTITQKRAFLGGCSNSTRGIFAGGDPGPFSIIDYITITEGGNATVFGDLTVARNGQAAASSQTRGVIGGGGTPSNLKTIDYVQFSTTSNAIDFGDLGTTGGRFIIGLSDSHGGLGGF